MKSYYALFLLLIGSFLFGTPVSAQWKQASGFSNSSGFTNYDDITGFTAWGNSLLAHADCSVDLTQFPNGTPDSLFVSIDNGQTWTSASGGVLPLLVSGSGATATFFANISGAVSYSNDLEQTWTTDSSGLTVVGLGGGAANSMTMIGNTFFLSQPWGVYQQSTPGYGWTIDTTGLGLGNTVSLGQVGNLIASGNNLFLSTGWSGIFFSSNQGSSWSAVNNGFTSFTANNIVQWLPVLQFAVSGSSVIAQTSHDLSNNGADYYSSDFYRSTNNGTNWTKMNLNPLSNWGSTYGLTASGQDVFAVTDSGFYASTDNGATWTQANQGLDLTTGFPTSIQISGSNIVIGTSATGAWTRKLSDFGSSSVSTVNSTPSYNLSESYPNPVSSTSKINYSLGKDDMISLTLFDVTGKEVTVLANSYQIAGDHTISFDGSALPAGMYFYRLTTADGSIGHWLQLIK